MYDHHWTETQLYSSFSSNFFISRSKCCSKVSGVDASTCVAKKCGVASVVGTVGAKACATVCDPVGAAAGTSVVIISSCSMAAVAMSPPTGDAEMLSWPSMDEVPTTCDTKVATSPNTAVQPA